MKVNETWLKCLYLTLIPKKIPLCLKIKKIITERFFIYVLSFPKLLKKFPFQSQKTDKGISGEILFNEEGKRTHFHLEITELSKDGFKRIGTFQCH